MALHKDKRRLFRRVRRILGSQTPLRADCGTLCGKRCCKGDETAGMLLFPGEKTSLSVRQNGTRRLAVCRGVCRRGERPLSCRLFPFLPVLQNGRVCARIDRRGAGICPLAQNEAQVRFSRRFLRRVERAGELLYADADCRRFLEEALSEGEQIREFRAFFLQKPEKP